MTELSEPLSADVPAGGQQLEGNLSAYKIALLVIAAAGPLGAVLTAAPIAFEHGNGAGLAGAFLLAGILMIFFSIGYGELIRAIPGAGAFYKYLTVIFGRGVGAGAAWVALASYLAITTAIAVASGYYTNMTMQGFGIDIGWAAWTVLYVGAICYLGRANIDFAAKILVPLVLAEFFVLFLLGISIFLDKGLNAFPVQAISVDAIMLPGLGVGLMVALASFLGVESAALYAMEARKPAKTIPHATRLAVVLVGVAYLIIIWLIIGEVGFDSIKDEAAIAKGGLVINLFTTRLGSTMATIVSLMLCTSNFCCLLSLHNAATRYVQVLAKDKHLPNVLSHVHETKKSPANASLLVTVLVALTIIVSSSLGYDAFVFLFPVTVALSTLGLIGLQTFVTLGVVVHFKKANDKRYFKTLISPLIALVGLSAAVYLIYDNYGMLTGSESAWVNGTPLLLVALFLYGIIKGRFRKADSSGIK
ncbi:APC family permease [Pseudomonas cedrina]|uniref:APC family permease n=1 Tax=Pseudomonas cedrina TaxID=651740 RepID=UPI003ED8B3D7